MRLDPASVEAVAVRTVQLLREEGLVAPAAPRLLTAEEVAARFGVTAAWARRHADRLGAVRLGEGPRARLRFDPEKVAAALAPHSDEPNGSGPAPPPRRLRRRAPVRQLDPAALPVRTPRGRRKDG